MKILFFGLAVAVISTCSGQSREQEYLFREARALADSPKDPTLRDDFSKRCEEIRRRCVESGELFKRKVVCASDMKRYLNSCHLQLRSCDIGEELVQERCFWIELLAEDDTTSSSKGSRDDTTSSSKGSRESGDRSKGKGSRGGSRSKGKKSGAGSRSKGKKSGGGSRSKGKKSRGGSGSKGKKSRGGSRTKDKGSRGKSKPGSKAMDEDEAYSTTTPGDRFDILA